MQFLFIRTLLVPLELQLVELTILVVPDGDDPALSTRVERGRGQVHDGKVRGDEARDRRGRRGSAVMRQLKDLLRARLQ